MGHTRNMVITMENSTKHVLAQVLYAEYFLAYLYDTIRRPVLLAEIYTRTYNVDGTGCLWRHAHVHANLRESAAHARRVLIHGDKRASTTRRDTSDLLATGSCRPCWIF